MLVLVPLALALPNCYLAPILHSLEPHEQVGRLLIVLCIGPIRIVLGTVKSFGVLTPSICIGACDQNHYCHAIVIGPGISLPVKRGVRVRTTVPMHWHYAIFVLVANLKGTTHKLVTPSYQLTKILLRNMYISI